MPLAIFLHPARCPFLYYFFILIYIFFVAKHASAHKPTGVKSFYTRLDLPVSVSITVKGEAKSGTTYVEHFMHNSMATLCIGLGYNLTYDSRARTTTCEFCANTPLYQFRQSAWTRHMNCSIGYWRFDVHNKHQPLDPEHASGYRILVLRDPIHILQSAYYHNTPKHLLSQRGLEKFVASQAERVFTSVNAWFLLHLHSVRNRTILWLYGDSPLQIHRPIASILNLPPQLIYEHIDIISNITRRDHMTHFQSLGGIPQGNARNLKVRQDFTFSLDTSLIHELVLKWNTTLDNILVDLWYSNNSSIRQAAQVKIRSFFL